MVQIDAELAARDTVTGERRPLEVVEGALRVTDVQVLERFGAVLDAVDAAADRASSQDTATHQRLDAIRTALERALTAVVSGSVSLSAATVTALEQALRPQRDGLTDAQLRALPVLVELDPRVISTLEKVTVTNFPAVYPLPSPQLDALRPPPTFPLPLAQLTQLTPPGNALRGRSLAGRVDSATPGTTRDVVTLVGAPTFQVYGFTATGNGDGLFRLFLDSELILAGWISGASPTVTLNLPVGLPLNEGNAILRVSAEGEGPAHYEGTIYGGVRA